jgi:hypothetical protein
MRHAAPLRCERDRAGAIVSAAREKALRAAADDPEAAYTMMLRASMIDAVRRAAAIP